MTSISLLHPIVAEVSYREEFTLIKMEIANRGCPSRQYWSPLALAIVTKPTVLLFYISKSHISWPDSVCNHQPVPSHINLPEIITKFTTPLNKFAIALTLPTNLRFTYFYYYRTSTSEQAFQRPSLGFTKPLPPCDCNSWNPWEWHGRCEQLGYPPAHSTHRNSFPRIHKASATKSWLLRDCNSWSPSKPRTIRYTMWLQFSKPFKIFTKPLSRKAR